MKRGYRTTSGISYLWCQFSSYVEYETGNIHHTWRRIVPTIAEGRLLSVYNSTTKPPRLDSFLLLYFSLSLWLFWFFFFNIFLSAIFTVLLAIVWECVVLQNKKQTDKHSDRQTNKQTNKTEIESLTKNQCCKKFPNSIWCCIFSISVRDERYVLVTLTFKPIFKTKMTICTCLQRKRKRHTHTPISPNTLYREQQTKNYW